MEGKWSFVAAEIKWQRLNPTALYLQRTKFVICSGIAEAVP